MIIGGELVGGGSLDGEVLDIVALVTTAGVDLSFRHDILGETNHSLAIALNGELFALVPSLGGEQQGYSFPSTIGDEEHRVDIVAVRGEARRVPDLHGAAYGRRAYLRWTAATATDLDAYVIYSNGGSGSVDYDEAMAEVGTVDVHRQWRVSGTGTGTGRITVGGSWGGDRVNASFTVETDDGTWRHNVSGSWSPWRAITRTPQTVDFGVVITFEDDPGDYAALTFGLRVGPLVEWSSDELAEGAWLFSVKARDVAGNLSTGLTELGLAIIHRPGAVTGLAVVFDPTAGNPVTLSWTLPGDVDLAAVEIYANYSNTFERLGDRILEDGPWVSLAANVSSYGFTPPEAGVWRFVVRTVDTVGRRSDTVQTVEVDTTGTPTAIALNQPEQVVVTPGPAGSFVVSWGYKLEDGESVATFRVYDVTGSPVQVGSVTAEADWFVNYSVPIVGPYASPATFVVAARSSGGVEVLSEEVEATPDSTAPSLSEPLVGVAN